MLVGKRCPATNIHYFVEFPNLKTHNALNINSIFLNLWIFTNLNMVFPVVVLVFDFDVFSEGVVTWLLHLIENII
jgi:hypothetical protein